MEKVKHPEQVRTNLAFLKDRPRPYKPGVNLLKVPMLLAMLNKEPNLSVAEAAERLEMPVSAASSFIREAGKALEGGYKTWEKYVSDGRQCSDAHRMLVKAKGKK